MEIVKDVAAVLGGILTLITLMTLIIKPIRNKIVDSIVSKAGTERRDELIQDMSQKIDQSLANDEDIKERLDVVEGRVLENELNRLKSEIFSCGNRCRRGIVLQPEEMANLREVYDRYSNKLHGNGLGHMEYEYIVEYYNNQALNK